MTLTYDEYAKRIGKIRLAINELVSDAGGTYSTTKDYWKVIVNDAFNADVVSALGNRENFNLKNPLIGDGAERIAR